MTALNPTRMQVAALRQGCRTCGVAPGMWCLNRKAGHLSAQLHMNRYYADGEPIQDALGRTFREDPA